MSLELLSPAWAHAQCTVDFCLTSRVAADEPLHLASTPGGTHIAAVLHTGAAEVWRAQAGPAGRLQYHKEAFLHDQAASTCIWLPSVSLQLAMVSSSGCAKKPFWLAATNENHV